MSYSNGPRIVNDGLVLYLDAGNSKSYPGAGTSWADLSGRGNTGTLTNGPTYSSANGGSLVFDGTDDYVSSFPTQISAVGSRTISCFFRTTTTTRNGLCGNRDFGNNGFVFTVNRTTPGNLTYFHTGGSTVERAAGISTNIWYNDSVTYNVTTATVILYLNGVQIGIPATSISSMNLSSFNGVIGNEDSYFSPIYTPFKGNIAQVSIYNRALSPTEILQNYNATKGRYSL